MASGTLFDGATKGGVCHIRNGELIALRVHRVSLFIFGRRGVIWLAPLPEVKLYHYQFLRR